MEKRYIKNFDSLSEFEQEIIKQKNILVIGLGGLGGFVLDSLARLGVNKIKLIDFDNFDITNLNRQLLSTEKNIGLSKVLEGKKYINSINSLIDVEIFNYKFEECCFKTIFEDIDIVFDCCDNIITKFNIEEQCQIFNTPLIYGAVAGYFGQVSCILPNFTLLKQIYPKKNIEGVESKTGNLCFVVSIVASLQINLFLKLILKKIIKTNGFYYIDINIFEIQWISFEIKKEK